MDKSNYAKSISTNLKENTNFMNILIKGIIFIIVFTVFYIIYQTYMMYGSTMNNLTEIRKKWPEYRCKPHIMPMAGFIGPKGTSGLQNGLECGMTFFKNSFLRFMTPFINFFERLIEVIVDLVKSVQNIRKMFNYLRDSVRNFLLDIANMFYAYAKKLSYLFNRFLELFHKIFLVFQDIMYGLGYGVYTIASLWNSPMGGVARFFCFTGETPIILNDGSNIQIRNVKVGDLLYGENEVLGVHIFSGKKTQMCSYDNKYIISTDHLIHENNKWIRAIKSKKTKIINNKYHKIYCLTTLKGIINLEDLLVSDYLEIPKNQEYKILKIINEKLNITTNNFSNERVWGIYSKNANLGSFGQYKNISDLRIGDYIGNNNKILGISKISTKTVKIYKKEIKKKIIIASGNTIINENGKWDYLKNIGQEIKNHNIEYLYQIFTETGEFNIRGTRIKDYDLVKDEITNRKINLLCEINLSI